MSSVIKLNAILKVLLSIGTVIGFYEIWTYLYYFKVFELSLVVVLTVITFGMLVILSSKIKLYKRTMFFALLAVSGFIFAVLIIVRSFIFTTDRVKWDYTFETLKRISDNYDICKQKNLSSVIEKFEDLYSDGKFKRIIKGNTVTVYSIGPDLVDDKGLVKLGFNLFDNSIHSEPWKYMFNKHWLYKISKTQIHLKGDIVLNVEC